MRVLIAMNATPDGHEIVREAVARPWPANSKFLLLHVLDPFPFARVPISLERARAAARKELEGAAEELRKTGWSTDTNVILAARVKRSQRLPTPGKRTWSSLARMAEERCNARCSAARPVRFFGTRTVQSRLFEARRNPRKKQARARRGSSSPRTAPNFPLQRFVQSPRAHGPKAAWRR